MLLDIVSSIYYLSQNGFMNLSDSLIWGLTKSIIVISAQCKDLFCIRFISLCLWLGVLHGFMFQFEKNKLLK